METQHMSDNIAVMKKWLDVLAQGDLASWRDLVDPRVVIEFPFLHGGQRTLNGIEEAESVIGGFWKIFEYFQWEDVDIMLAADGDILITRANSRARTVDGRAYTNSYVLIVTLAQGKVIHHMEYFDAIRAAELTAT
jgi:ketosteroid isomerase-like protein